MITKEEIAKEKTQIEADFEQMYAQKISSVKYSLRRTLLSDIPDAELEAFGPPKGKEEEYEDFFEDVTQGGNYTDRDKKVALEFVDHTFGRIYNLGFQTLYWDLEASQYMILF